MANNSNRCGLYGKIPAHGDFVRRGLPANFISPWDAWLSKGLLAVQEALGEQWEAAWDAAPAWRFRLAPAAFGPMGALGILMPSHDTGGRRFAITGAALLPIAGVMPDASWFDELEMALSAGRHGDVDADGLAERLPYLPEDDLEATFNARSLFWRPGVDVQKRLPEGAEFLELLGIGT